MFYFTIFHNGQAIAGEFGRSAEHAVERYAAGSTYPEASLSARRGTHPLQPSRGSIFGNERADA